MSNLFMDMHRTRCRWHNHQNTPPTSAPAAATATNLAGSQAPSSTRHVSDQIFSHHNKGCAAAGEDAVRNASCNLRGSATSDGENEEEDTLANVLSLKLRKPRHWKWELTTSKSSSSIALPRILLYNHKGELLVDAQGESQRVYRQEDHMKPKYKGPCPQLQTQQTEYLQRSATTNLTHSISKAVEREFNSLRIEEATPSPEPSSPASMCSHRSRKAINFSTTDLPDCVLSRRSSSLKSVGFDEANGKHYSVGESQIPEFLPTPPSTTTPTSSSSGPRGKRKYRHSQSSGRSSAHSESILERFSYQKGRFSSPEYAEESELQRRPRYFLRTCKAGTLVVKQDSFNLHPRRRRRRPPNNRSTESLLSVKLSPLSSLPHAQQQFVCKSPTSSDISCSGKRKPMRRYFSLSKETSPSDRHIAVAAGQKQQLHSEQPRNQTKDSNYSTGLHQHGKVR